MCVCVCLCIDVCIYVCTFIYLTGMQFSDGLYTKRVIPRNTLVAVYAGTRNTKSESSHRKAACKFDHISAPNADNTSKATTIVTDELCQHHSEEEAGEDREIDHSCSTQIK